jgi:hypothetical protein
MSSINSPSIYSKLGGTNVAATLRACPEEIQDCDMV